MKQDQDLLARVSQGAISDPQKCALCYAVYKEFLESEMDAVQLNYDAQLNEIYLKLSRGGRESICLPRSINDRLDFDQIDSFRKRLQDTQYPWVAAVIRKILNFSCSFIFTASSWQSRTTHRQHYCTTFTRDRPV